MKVALRQMLASASPIGAQVPVSQTIIGPPPYSPSGITPSKSMYSTGWSSVCDREPLLGRVERRALRHRPALQHAVELEPQVVVVGGGVVLVHDEAVAAVARRGPPAGSEVRAKSRLAR